ncbi:hypothetical protein T06_13695 [Trichinella sp. T6]|nr:hypothetical protein T06_13695 [Trichinella sp. T6]
MVHYYFITLINFLFNFASTERFGKLHFYGLTSEGMFRLGHFAVMAFSETFSLDDFNCAFEALFLVVTFF